MIGLIKGTVVDLSAPQACVMTASGVGYEIELPLPDFCQLQLHADCQIWTHLHVREDAQLLFGFNDKATRQVFRTLIRINGVGAKMALAMLSTFSANELKQCVQSENDTALTRVPGVGKKTAQRLLIELKDKLDHIDGSSDAGDLSLATLDASHLLSETNNEAVVIAEVESALISLGYREKEAQLAIKSARSQVDDADRADGDAVMDTQTLLKRTLKQLSGF